jgi:hypothetical protein
MATNCHTLPPILPTAFVLRTMDADQTIPRTMCTPAIATVPHGLANQLTTSATPQNASGNIGNPGKMLTPRRSPSGMPRWASDSATSAMHENSHNSQTKSKKTRRIPEYNVSPLVRLMLGGRLEEYRLPYREAPASNDGAVDPSLVVPHPNNRLQHLG